MEFVKLVFSSYGNYSYEDASSEKMIILGHFLATDVSDDITSFKEYAFNDWEQYICGNLTALEKENSYIFLSDLYSEEKTSIALKINLEQYVHILDNWQEKVWKLKPKEVIIKYENDQYIVETKD